MTQNVPKTGLIHMTAHGGHHAAYHDLFGRLFDLNPSSGRIGFALFRQLVGASRVFFGTLDDDVRGFIAVALARALLGRRTGGLFLHPNSCLERGLKGRVKWLVFAALSRVPGVTVISILPFDLMPGLHNVATTFVHDPQFWDQLDDPPAIDVAAEALICERAAGRPVVAFLGWGTREKAYPFLADIAAERRFSDQILVVSAGKVMDDVGDAVDRLEASGALVWRRFVSDAEMAAIYAVSRWIWVCYAPGYEQASGIFGRAVQSARAVLVRGDSLTIASYARQLQHPMLMLPDDSAAAAQVILAALRSNNSPAASGSATTTQQSLREWKARFMTVVQASMG